MLFSLENLTFGYAGVPILENVSFSMSEGERVGLVGGNGEGKTTLLRLIVGQLVPDAGEVKRRGGLKFGYLEQNGGFESEATVYDALRAVFREDDECIAALRDAERRLATASSGETEILYAKIEACHKKIAARDSYSVDVRIRSVLGGMGLGEVEKRPVSTLSGGEKTRLKLCRLLLEAPELLILDEPTNHLDIKTLFWLEDYLAAYKGALLVVSHDRYFLDRVTEKTVELERKILTPYRGNYSKYRLLREARRLEEARAYARQQEEIAKLRDYVARNLVRATTAKSALSRVNKLERMEVLDRPTPPAPAPRFCFRAEQRPYEKILSAENFSLTAGGKTLISRASFTLMRGERVGLVGDNGTGKSTLIKFLAGDDRRVVRGRSVKIGYYDQENADLDGDARVLDALWEKARGRSQTEVRAILARVGLGAEDVEKQVAALSGGMRAKLALAVLECRGANALLLDEPTNHLDLASREALEDALSEFDGTLLFVSHDRRFIERLATRILTIEDGTLVSFSGTYQQFLDAHRAAPPPKVREEKPAEGFHTKKARAEEAKARTRMREIEQRLEAIEREQEALNAELAAGTYDYKRVAEISAALAELNEESDRLYSEYENYI